MSIVFPNTGLVANTTTYTLDTRTWLWTGQGWKIVATTITGPSGSAGPTGPTGPGNTVADLYLNNMYYG